jgi:acyl-CoA ligase (AMP-forming) (exosortase A-associated)
MAYLVHQLIEEAAQRTPDALALQYRTSSLSYSALADAMSRFASGLIELGLMHDDRVAVYLPKRFESIVAMFGAMAAGGVMVPINPSLKAAQVGHILSDCAAEILVTSRQRLAGLSGLFEGNGCRCRVVVVDEGSEETALPGLLPATVSSVTWSAVTAAGPVAHRPRIDADMAAILYTSGSTGRPKGVVLTHRNLVAGAQSVAAYLSNSASDRLLAVLPFSFDYGFSQLSTAFSVGASVVLLDYLLPRDVINAVAQHQVSGLAAVPPLWNQLAGLDWPEAAAGCLRYLTNSGGVMPRDTTRRLQEKLPATRIFLMYGLTEAFRSTYLDPDLVARHPDSIGRAIPNAQVMVVRQDGSECDTDEPGEMVHRGALVAAGYWNDPDATARRFRPAPGQATGVPLPEIAVWSGDTVRRDGDGLLYFIGREDEMIKTSGYRVSPTEIEEVALEIPGVEQAVALGPPHPQLGQAIVLVVQLRQADLDETTIIGHCRRALPSFMLPAAVVIESALPTGANGKIDRKTLADRFAKVFEMESER